MTRTIGRIARDGVIHLGDACLSVVEEGIPREWNAARAWEKVFHRDVFSRIVQTLNRLGWTVGPGVYIWTGNEARHCRKGDLQADLLQQGRSITFKMFQAVNCPKRPDHDGRYEWNKESLMPYPMRLEMERTRRRIRDYLVNVFTGYVFKPERLPSSAGLAFIRQSQDELTQFHRHNLGDNIAPYNAESADGAMLQEGDRVYYRRDARWLEGIAYYHINNMWWVLSPGGVVHNMACFHLCTRTPAPLRGRSFKEDEIWNRLTNLKDRAVKAENFERAAVLRDVLSALESEEADHAHA